jgi:hypothetical protein
LTRDPVLLGPERRHARLVAALQAALAQQCHAERHAGRRLCCRAALLKALDKVRNPEDGRAVVAAMKALPTDDPIFGKGSIRQDGRKLHPMYLFQVKSPKESKEDWDVFKLLATVPAEQAFRPMSEGKCAFVAGK